MRAGSGFSQHLPFKMKIIYHKLIVGIVMILLGFIDDMGKTPYCLYYFFFFTVVYKANVTTMRRTNKPSGYSAAAPPGHIQRTSHLDIPSSHDDEPSDKLHKSKRARASKSKILVTALCSLAALGTLLYVAKLVNSHGAIGLLQLGKSAKIAAVHNMKNRHHHQHHAAKSTGGHIPPQQNLLPPDSIYRSTITDIHGVSQNLIQYAGSISLIVNVACE